MKRRLIVLSVIFTLLLTACVGRLVSISIIDGKKYKEIAIQQSTALISGITARGNIYDRKGNYLTGMEECLIYLIEKRKIDHEALSLLEDINAQKINDSNERYYVYSSSVLDKGVYDKLIGDYGAIVIKTRQRYSDDQPAIHVIGYVNHSDDSGACGIEKEYDSILSSVDRNYYGKFDGHGYLIRGLGIDIKGDNHEWGIVTTLDLDIQRAAEKILEEANESGAIIVVEAATGNILASASSPSYSPKQIVKYLESSGEEFLNKSMNCQYPPGSIFKIIVIAAGLGEGIVAPDSRFVCNGYHEINGHKFRCSTGGPEGHGEISLHEAFSKSCNAVFIQLGEMVGAELILKYARDFGMLDRPVSGFSSQSAGNLPDLQDCLGAGIGNLAIGQGKLLITPAQVARITKTIANDGLDSKLLLIEATIEGLRGKVLYPKQLPKRIISRQTARAIKDMMAETVKSGTADNLDLKEGLSAAGKTGSAEATHHGKHTVHSWFTAFTPSNIPEYIITVFIENGGSGRKSAVPIFNKMLDAIYR
ncbi:MAG: hypothetical protein GX076_08880 [Clostridiales bacterium]|jgi:cell division protein FtsI/penicillin-binding protein 2|nr:hypothetical protein [Clostridiales bacterium]